MLTFEGAAVFCDAEQTCDHNFGQQSDIAPQKQTENSKLLQKYILRFKSQLPKSIPTISVQISEWGGCLFTIWGDCAEWAGGGNGRIVGVGWGNVWGNIWQCMAMYDNVWQCMGWCMRQSSSRKQGRGRMGSDSSRKWGEQKGPCHHHHHRQGRKSLYTSYNS